MNIFTAVTGDSRTVSLWKKAESFLPSSWLAIQGHLQSTLALRTPRYYRHPAIANKGPPPGETHKEMIEVNSRYYRRNCDTFMLPVRNFPCFFSCYSGHYVQILTHVIKSEIKIKENKETLSSIGCEYENFLLVARSFSGSWGHVKNFMFAY